MGSCSNRSETKEERIAGYAKDVISYRYRGENSDFDWQCSVGARIRGDMGVEKGNAFIADMKKYSK